MDTFDTAGINFLNHNYPCLQYWSFEVPKTDDAVHVDDELLL